MWNIENAFKSDRVMKALTGLSISEFQKLKHPFEEALNETINQAQKPRQRAFGGGRKHTLSTVTKKLFFILCYLKCYPTFDMIAFYFGVNISQANRWVHGLLPALEKALGKEAVLPERQIENMEEFKKLFPDIEEAFIDGTERPTQRSKNTELQKSTYSGKKKRHTKKNLVVTTVQRKVLILSSTKDGKQHDYSNFKEADLGNCIPDDVVVYVDLGFQGIRKDYPNLAVLIPHKKPRNSELSEKQKQQNRFISGVRVLVEHAIGGIKRIKAVSDIYRNHKEAFEDTLMFMACGLWNFHLKILGNLLKQ